MCFSIYSSLSLKPYSHLEHSQRGGHSRRASTSLYPNIPFLLVQALCHFTHSSVITPSTWPHHFCVFLFIHSITSYFTSFA